MALCALVTSPRTKGRGMESIGRYLKRNREQRSIGLEAIARETRIPVVALEALESDRFDELPAEVFVRGFVRAYARALSVSGDEAMTRYTLARRAASVAPVSTGAPGRQRPKKGNVGMAVGFVVLLLLVTVALALALNSRGERTAPRLVSAPRNLTVALL